MNVLVKSRLKEEVETLAAEAFHQHLISGYGDGEYPDEYQIVIQGRPKHFTLEYARSFLANLIEHSSFGTGLIRSMIRSV